MNTETLASLRLPCLCFSRDRPLQLDGFIRSILRFASHPVEITVLYSATEPEYGKAYQELEQAHPDVCFVPENDFGEQTLEWVHNLRTPLALFGCDDVVYHRPFEVAAIYQEFSNNPQLLGFSLRLGNNIRFSHTRHHEVIKPPFLAQAPFLRWNWRGCEADWGYPFELDGTVYPAPLLKSLLSTMEELRKQGAFIDWRHPNMLETAGNQLLRKTTATPAQLAAFPEACLVVPTVNQVQKLADNRLMGDHRSPRELETMRCRGHEIDLDAYAATSFDRVHIGAFFTRKKDHAPLPANGPEHTPGSMAPTSSLHFFLLDGDSRYNVFRVWLSRLREALQASGYHAEIITSNEEQNIGMEEGTVTLGFNLIRNWQAGTAARPHLLWLVDPPPYQHIFFTPRLSKLPVRPDRCAVACVDQEWVRMASQLYHAQNVFFLPHAASLAETTSPEAAQRDLDAVFIGSFEQPDTILAGLRERAKNHWPLIARVIEQQLADPETPLWATSRALADVINWTPEQLQLFINLYYPDIDRYLRNRSRQEWLASLENFKVHIYGTGDWPAISWPKSLTIHPPVPFEQIPTLLRRTRTLINHAPSHRHGSHERIFDALLCGASVLTTPSSLVADILPPSHGVLMAATPGELPARMAEALATSPSDIHAGQQTVLRDHTMQQRAKPIIEAAQDLVAQTQTSP